MNVLQWTKKALKQLKVLPSKEQEKVFIAVDSLINYPQVNNVKSLTNRDDYRLRVGRYRVLFTDRKSTRLNSSHSQKSRMPSSA